MIDLEPRIEDRGLLPLLDKVSAGERLSYEDGVRLFRSNDLLAVGYLANIVRERMHGNVTYFNVNRHINPTDVCVASCKLCAFGKKFKDPTARTMSLEEIWHRAGEGYREAITEFHIVGGLHAARAEAALPEGPSEGLHDGRDRLLCQALQAARGRSAAPFQGGRHGLHARRRGRDLQ
jgi:2-iminoacetate synthase ThiH